MAERSLDQKVSRRYANCTTFLSDVDDKKMRCAVDYFLGSLAISVLTGNALDVNNPVARMIVMVLLEMR